MATPNRLDSVIALAKRRGFVFQAGEIYGGSRSAWDYGPLGTALKENIKRQWWKSMVQGRDDIVGIDSSVILPRQVWEASGHVEVFTDPLVESLHTHKRYRADHLLEAYEEKHGHPPANGLADINDPDTGQPGSWTEPQNFSGLLKTFLGPVDNEEGMALPAPRDRAGHLRQLRQRAVVGAHEAAVRHRAGRQELPQRDHARQLHLPHPRVRADGDGVLRRARHRRGVARVLDRRSRGAGTSTSASTPRTCAATSTRRRSSRTTRSAPSTSSTGSASPGSEWGELMGVANRTDFDLKTHSEAVGHRPVVLRPDQERALDPVRDRARVRPHPRAHGVPRRRVRRRRGAQRQGRRRQAHRAAPRPPPRAGQGRRAAAVAQRAALAARARGRRRPAQALERSTSTTPARSAAATAARTRSARRSASPSTSTRSTTTP